MHIITRSPSSPATVIAALVLAGATVASSCGDDAEPLSKEDFLEQANALCEATNEQAGEIFASMWDDIDGADPDDPANELIVFTRFEEAIGEIRPIFEQQLDDLRALAAPVGDEELVDDLLDDWDAAMDEIATLVSSASDGDESAMQALDGTDPFDEVDRRAIEYGLTVCGDDD